FNRRGTEIRGGDHRPALCRCNRQKAGAASKLQKCLVAEVYAIQNICEESGAGKQPRMENTGVHLYSDAGGAVRSFLSEVPSRNRNKNGGGQMLDNFPHRYSMRNPSISGWRYFQRRCSAFSSYGNLKILYRYLKSDSCLISLRSEERRVGKEGRSRMSA